MIVSCFFTTLLVCCCMCFPHVLQNVISWSFLCKSTGCAGRKLVAWRAHCVSHRFASRRWQHDPIDIYKSIRSRRWWLSSVRRPSGWRRIPVCGQTHTLSLLSLSLSLSLSFAFRLCLVFLSFDDARCCCCCLWVMLIQLHQFRTFLCPSIASVLWPTGH